MARQRAVAALLMLAGCVLTAALAWWMSGRVADQPRVVPPTTTAPSSVAQREQALPTPPSPSASKSGTDQAEVLRERTSDFVSSYLSPTDPQWRTKVSEYLSASLVSQLDTVDPARVPSAAVTGVQIVADEYTAQATAQTTAGPMTVTWSWLGDRWEVTSFVPPVE
jgi:hypothetical protein